MNSTPDPPKRRRFESRRSVVLRTAGMILFAAALLFLVMGVTILRNEPADSHAPQTPIGSVWPSSVTSSPGATGSVAATGSATTNVSAVQLSAYQQAKAAEGYLTGAAAVDQLQIYDRVPPGSQLVLTFPREGKKQISSTFLIIGEDEDAHGTSLVPDPPADPAERQHRVGQSHGSYYRHRHVFHDASTYRTTGWTYTRRVD